MIHPSKEKCFLKVYAVSSWTQKQTWTVRDAQDRTKYFEIVRTMNGRVTLQMFKINIWPFSDAQAGFLKFWSNNCYVLFVCSLVYTFKTKLDLQKSILTVILAQKITFYHFGQVFTRRIINHECFFGPIWFCQRFCDLNTDC